MRCISIRPPWSLVVADGRKTIENRPRPTRVRGPVLIHSSKRYNDDAEAFIRRACKKIGLPVPTLEDLRATPRGAIIGLVDIVECVSLVDVPRAQRAWALGPYCYFLTRARMFKQPIPYKGSLGFFNVPDEIVARAMRTASSSVARS